MSNQVIANGEQRLVIAETNLGFVAAIFQQETLSRLKFGILSFPRAVNFFGGELEPVLRKKTHERNFVRELSKFAKGKDADFGEFPIDFSWCTAFERKVYRACQGIRRGKVLAYGELAAKAGAKGAARAVGTAMRKNRVPILVPCHRVVAANGKPGGYSGADGINTKIRLLELEGVFEYS